MQSLREKLKDSKLYDAKVKAIHLKEKLGKLENLVNRNHRHDEAHEQATDKKRSELCGQHRFKSYFPIRPGNKIKWYVDGRDYFWAVSVALESAKETIYIEDWWLSPELFLRRPPFFNQEWRLDQTIKRAAERGVQIYVIVYKEVSQALTCNSAHTKHALRNLCPEGAKGHGNIRVLRHPDHNVFENLGDMTFYWAHHEKFIVIDYHQAFIGGLDMCYGRWDLRQHLLADVHPSGVQNEIFPGQDFNNNRIMDFHTVEDWSNNELSKADFGRMPWHDVSMGLVGECVYDIAEHFVLRWNFIKRDKYKRDDTVDYLCLEGRAKSDGSNPDEDLIAIQRPKHPMGKYIEHPLSPLDTKGLKNSGGTVKAQIVRSSDDWSSGILLDHSIQNAYAEVIENAQHYVYIENQFFITATGEQQAPIHNTVGRAIVNACVRAGKEGRKFRVIIIIPAIPGFAGDLRQDAAIGTRAIMDYQYKSIHRGEHSIMGQIEKAGFNPRDYIFVFNLRAYDRIARTPALMKQEKESGVSYQELQRAEAEEIMGESIHGHESERKDPDARHAGPSVSKDEKQRIIDRKRRFEAARQKMDVRDPVTSADSISEDAMARGGLVSEEPWEGDDPEQEKENFVQEELYVHAKLLIADDRIVICGSSNLNDRSQLGSHDSEISIVMEDTATISTTMDGKPYEAGHHAATLRRHLWREHLGTIEAQTLDASDDPNAQPVTSCGNAEYGGDEWDFVADPLSDSLWSTWCDQASTNTEIYRRLFRADPDDHIRTWKEYDDFAPRHSVKQGHLNDPFMPVAEVRKTLDKVRGHLVWMPLHFLEDEEMAEKGLQVNQYTESIYT